MKPLTSGQRRALTILTMQAARVVPPGREVGRLDVSWAVAHALTQAGYARRTDGARWLIITQAGRGALATPIRDTPRLLAPAGRPARTEHGYTDIPGNAMRDEPEAVSEAEQAKITKDAALSTDAALEREHREALRMYNAALDFWGTLPNDRLAKSVRHSRALGTAIDAEIAKAA